MAEPTHILFLITATTCGACKNLKGDGTLNNGTPFMDKDFNKHILDIKNNKNYRVKIAHVNFKNLGQNSPIDYISVLKYEKNIIVQHKYVNENENVRYLKYTDGKSKPSSEMDKTDTWDAFLKRSYVNVFNNHLSEFPSWFIVKTEEYNKKIKNPNYKIKIHGVTIRNERGEIVYHLSKNDKAYGHPVVVIEQGFEILDQHNQPIQAQPSSEVVEMIKYVYDYDVEL